MNLYVKIGTMPGDVVITRKRKPPIVGESFAIRERPCGSKYEQVRCTLIKEVSPNYFLYFVDR